MKRSYLLLAFALTAFVLTAGYSDSRVIKETPTYQVTAHDSYTVSAAQVDALATESFVLVSPELGVPNSVETIQVTGQLENGYRFTVRPPPRIQSQKSELTLTLKAKSKLNLLSPSSRDDPGNRS